MAQRRLGVLRFSRTVEDHDRVVLRVADHCQERSDHPRSSSAWIAPSHRGDGQRAKRSGCRARGRSRRRRSSRLRETHAQGRGTVPTSDNSTAMIALRAARCRSAGRRWRIRPVRADRRPARGVALGEELSQRIVAESFARPSPARPCGETSRTFGRSGSWWTVTSVRAP